MEQLGPYRLLNEIARGGMGAVYRAQDTRSGRHVALKVLLDPASDLELLERFRRETTLLRELDHPNLVRVLDVSLEPPRPYAAFELVEGGTLQAQVEREGPLPWPTAARLLAEVAAGVAAAHERGLLHRDIKPENVLLTDSGAKLADFGLVKDLDQETLTQSGSTLGTPSYLAPEQVGADKDRWGPATDVYGLAATLYFSLTGVPPFSGPTTIATLQAVTTDPPPSPRKQASGVPPWLDALCTRGLAKRSVDRFSNAVAFRAALLHGAGARASQGKRPAIMLAVALALALGSTAALLWRSRTSAQERAQLLVAEGRAKAHAEPQLALLDLEQALELDPTNAEAHAARGKALTRLDRFDDALAAFGRALELAPDLALAYQERARCWTQTKQVELALADLDRAIELDPQSAGAHSHRGSCQRLLGNHQAATKDLTRAIELAPDSPRIYFLRGRSLATQNKPDAAERDFDRAIELDPRFARAHFERGRIKVASDRFRMAIEDFDRAIELDPKIAEAYEFRGIAKRYLGDLEQAIADYDRALARSPGAPDVLARRGIAYIQTGKIDSAVQDFDRALEVDPKHYMAYRNRASVFLTQRLSERALADIDQALRIDRSEPGAHEIRGSALAQLGRLPEAIASYSEGIRLRPNATLFAQRGLAQMRLERYAQAVEDFEQAFDTGLEAKRPRLAKRIRRAWEGALKRLAR